MKRIIAAMSLVFALAACNTEPDWSLYSPEVKQRIDSAAARGDCATLQAEFDSADANDAPQRARTGEGNAELMAYIDAKMSDAGCYG